MTNVFIFTAANPDAQKHYEKTIKNSYDLNKVLPLISDSELKKSLELAYPDKRCYMWGAFIGGTNQGTWNNMNVGDLVLGYWDRTIRCACYVVAKLRNSALAEQVWGHYERPFELIYFLTKPQFCNVSIDSLPLGDRHMRFTRVNESNVQEILKKYGTLNNFLEKGLSQSGQVLDRPKAIDVAPSEFTWLPFFEEMLNVICTKYDKKTLCAVFHKIFEDSGGRKDKFEGNQSRMLEEIDPCTFIAYFNRSNTIEKRIAFCTEAKNVFEMSSEVPTDFTGIPTFDPRLTWFFSYAVDRKESVMATLWAFAQSLNNNQMTDQFFANALTVKYVGIAKLSQIMFICKPYNFVAFDSINMGYFKKVGLNISVANFTEYQSALSKVKEYFAPKTFYEISHEAYLDSISKVPEVAKIPIMVEKPLTPELDESPLSSTYSIEDFVNETGFSREIVDMWRNQLQRKKQVIFYGPPGTGKTYIAERLAKLMVSGTNGATDIVQFHPAYSYEDFIQGIRPKLSDGQLDYQIEPGRFLRFCEQTTEKIPAPSVLIIDEINRAKLSSVFGEIVYCLEYRDKPIQLAADGKFFKIPENLYIIGTMNTADRSIVLVDHALRRRFCFIRLQPEYDILQKYLDTNGYDGASLVSVLKEINGVINDVNYELGISFFMDKKSKLQETLPSIWQGEIEPYLQELFYDKPQRIAEYRWQRLAAEKLKAWVS